MAHESGRVTAVQAQVAPVSYGRNDSPASFSGGLKVIKKHGRSWIPDKRKPPCSPGFKAKSVG